MLEIGVRRLREKDCEVRLKERENEERDKVILLY